MLRIRKRILTAGIALAMVATSFSTAQSNILPPPPPPPQPAPIQSGGGSTPVAPIVVMVCIGGTVFGALLINAIYRKEANGPGLCGLGMQPATCEDIARASYSPSITGETPAQVKQQRLVEMGCLRTHEVGGLVRVKY